MFPFHSDSKENKFALSFTEYPQYVGISSFLISLTEKLGCSCLNWTVVLFPIGVPPKKGINWLIPTSTNFFPLTATTIPSLTSFTLIFFGLAGVT